MKASKAIMFGYHGEAEKDVVGYLCVNQLGSELYSVVESESGATRFKAEDAEKWAGFFNTEDDLKPWVFHPVYVNN